jgi:PAS domain-containing protein
MAHEFQDRAAQALRWHSENLKQQGILDALEAEVVVLDKDGRISGFNRAWREFANANGNPELRGCNVGDDYLGPAARLRRSPKALGRYWPDAATSSTAMNATAHAAGAGSSCARRACQWPKEARW